MAGQKRKQDQCAPEQVRLNGWINLFLHRFGPRDFEVEGSSPVEIEGTGPAWLYMWRARFLAKSGKASQDIFHSFFTAGYTDDTDFSGSGRRVAAPRKETTGRGD